MVPAPAPPAKTTENQVMDTTLSETERLQALRRYAILDTAAERGFDDLARLASLICETPISLVSFVDADRQWFKARVGLGVEETPRQDSFCHHAIRGAGLFVVPDARLDDRFRANPLVTGDPHVRFYAGMPLQTEDGHSLGTLCVIDREPRKLSENQQLALEALGRLAVDQLELHRQAAELARSEQILRVQHERLSLAIEGMTEGVWDWNAVTGETYFSPRYSELINDGEPLEPTRRSWESRLHPDDRAATLASLSAHLERREPYNVEYRLMTGSLGYRWFRSQGQAKWDEAGRPTRMVGLITDVTGRKIAEQELNLMKIAIDNANDAILITEAEPIVLPGPRVVYCNKAFTRTTGYTPEDILGKTPRILQGPGTSRETLDKLKKKLKGWKEVRVELLNYKKDGTEFWVELNIRPVADARGWYTHWISVQRDITERKRAEAAERIQADNAIRESRELLQAVVTSAPVIVFALDREGVYTLSEGRGLEALGLKPGEAVGRRAEDPEIHSPIRADDVRRALLGESFGTVVEVAGLAFDSRISPLKERDGAVSGVIGVATDVTARKHAELEINALNAQLGTRLERIAALRRVDMTIRGSLDLRVTLNTLLDQIMAQLDVDAASVLLLDPHARALNEVASRGLRGASTDRAPVPLGEGAVGRAALTRSPVQVAASELAEPPTGRTLMLADQGLMVSYAIPLVAKGLVKGVLEVTHRSGFDAGSEWVDFLESLADQAAIATDNAALFAELQTSNAEMTLAYDATIEGWSRALDLRDKETEGHTQRVTKLSVRLAQALGVSGADLTNVRRGALLHDIGKMGIPDAILLKPGPLDAEEWTIMRRHPEYAYQWLSPVSFLRPALEIPYSHHEKWDGTGYPRGLAGEQIPLAARLFAAVDIWDALRSDRPYRAAWPVEKVVDHIRSLSGTHLDPRIVEAFLRIAAEDEASSGNVLDLSFPDDSVEEQLRLATLAVEELRLQQEELLRLNRELGELSRTDELTGLKNRRHFHDALNAALGVPDRPGRPLSLILIDVDHFKAYNDAYGHPAGDHVLREVATVLREQTRSGDTTARYGGEEFVILMPRTDAKTANLVAQRLLKAVAEIPWPLRAVTVSFGIVTAQPETSDASMMISDADQALYQSKRQGRNRITHVEPVGRPVESTACLAPCR